MENERELKSLIWLGTAIIFVSVLGVILITIIYQNYILKIREQESKARLNATLKSEKQERYRIASDLHDGISGDLNAVRNFITILEGIVKNKEGVELLNEMQNAVENAIENIRIISYNLIPPMLESHGLVCTVENYLHRIKTSSNIKINEFYDIGSVNLSTENAYEIYRIIQELIANLIKHGKADNIDLTITNLKEILIVTITDNSYQFNLSEKLETSSGLGLRSISTRISKLNATLEHTFFHHQNITKIYYHVKDSYL